MFAPFARKIDVIALAGFITTAISFGPARIGFGLFLPTFRDTFALSSSSAGYIASLTFIGFLLGLPLSSLLSQRFNDRIPILFGVLCATLGFGLVAGAHTVFALAVGVTLAGMSAGLCWTPFNDIAEKKVPCHRREHTLSTIATGTAIGVTLTGIVFIGVAYEYISWRSSWQIFCIIGAIAILGLALIVPKECAPRNTSSLRINHYFRKELLVMYLAAFCFGASNAAYLSFGADYAVSAGALGNLPKQVAASIIFISYGIAGIAGLATGKVIERIGIYPLLIILLGFFGASFLLLVFFAQSWIGLISSAALHGAAVMMISAVLSCWSLRLFPGNGTQGFTAALYAVALGSIVAPALVGTLADMTNLNTALLASSAIPLCVSVIFIFLTLRKNHTHDRL